MAEPRRDYLVAFGLLGVATMWGSNTVFVKAVLAEFDPLAFTLARFVLMTAMGFALLRLRSPDIGILRSDRWRFAASGLTGYTLFQLGFILGLNETSAFSTSLLIGMVPIFTAIALTLLHLERISAGQWVGIGLALLGVVVFVWEKTGGIALADSGRGDLLSLGAGAAFALYGIVNKPLVARYGAMKVTTYSLLFGTVPLAIIGAPGALAQPWASISGTAWLVLGYSVVFPVYLAYLIWNWGIARKGVAYTSLFGYLPPVISGVFAFLLLGERFGPLKLGGALLVLLGLALATRRSAAPRPAAEVKGVVA